MGPRICLDSLDKRKSPASTGIRNPDRSIAGRYANCTIRLPVTGPAGKCVRLDRWLDECSYGVMERE